MTASLPRGVVVQESRLEAIAAGADIRVAFPKQQPSITVIEG